MKKILILTANPKNTDRIRLDEEVREIQAVLDQSKNRDQFEIVTHWAVRVDDLQPILLKHKPDIVHFSGHGGGSQGLALENKLGQMQLVSSTALAGLFKLVKANVKCVFLNACYTDEQAKAIHPHIKYVVGMNQAIGDRAAIEFAKGFYGAIGTGETYEEAFEFGRNAIDLHSIPESSTPVIKVRTRIKRVFICYGSQALDQELARQFFAAIKAAGHEAFTAEESIRVGEDRRQRIADELEQSDYFLLLLSEQSAVSEMLMKEVRRAKRLRESRSRADQRPMILPIRVNLPINSPLNHDLRKDLQNIEQREWKSLQDTPALVQEVLTLLSTGHSAVRLKKKRSPIKKMQAKLLTISRELKSKQIQLSWIMHDPF